MIGPDDRWRLWRQRRANWGRRECSRKRADHRWRESRRPRRWRYAENGIPFFLDAVPSRSPNKPGNWFSRLVVPTTLVWMKSMGFLNGTIHMGFGREMNNSGIKLIFSEQAIDTFRIANITLYKVVIFRVLEYLSGYRDFRSRLKLSKLVT